MVSSRLFILIHLFQFASVCFCTTIISNTTNEYINTVLSCNDGEQCSIRCLHYRSCMASTIQCNKATTCSIHCEGLESCFGSSIYQSSSNTDVDINCIDKKSCLHMNIYQQQSIALQITNASTFTLHALAPSSASGLKIHDTITHTSYNIHCNASLSCSRLSIDFNPNLTTSITPSITTDYTMNIECYGIESCKDIRIESTDNWYNFVATNDITYNTFEVNVYCGNILSCEDAAFDFSSLLMNGYGEERTAGDFGTISIYCTDQDSACDYMNIICPDLVPFDAYYDYMYQQNNIKCHIWMVSYSEIVTVVSKHGFNMVDIECDATNNEICDQVTLYCSEVDIKCAMKYDTDSLLWYCDDLDEYYTFESNDAAYGCSYFVWFSDTTVIKTSELPDYDIYTYQYLWCLRYNPAMTAQCIIDCDTEGSCYEATLDCGDATQCIINCNAKQSCAASLISDDFVTILCPYNWPYDDSAISPVRSCEIAAHPELETYNYGSFYTELWIVTYDNNIVSIDQDPTLSWFVFDYGMTSLDVTIADYPIVANFSVYDDYFVDNWYRIHNQYGTYDPVYVTISCTFCYNVWILFNGYWSKYGSISTIYCTDNCMNSQIDIYGMTWNYVYCGYTNSNCNATDITIVDGYLEAECYSNCDELNIYNNPYYHSNYTVFNNVYLLSYEYAWPLEDTINIYSLYGFDTITVSYYYYPALNPLYFIHGHCGYPDYYLNCGSYPFLNTSCTFTECSVTNPQYSTMELATIPFQLYETEITSLFTVCKAYESCWNIDIRCGDTDVERQTTDTCLVKCDARFACYNSSIYSDGYPLTLDCVGYRSCENVNVYASSDTQDMTINCLNALSCRSMYIDASIATNIEETGTGLSVTCFDLNQVLDIVSYRSKSCIDLQIQCPSTPTSHELVHTDYMDTSPKCHLKMDNNIISASNIIVRNEANGVSFFDMECEYNNMTQISSCINVVYICDANDTMYSTWYYDLNTNDHICNGTCCDFINSEPPTSAPTSAPSRAPTVWRYSDFFTAIFEITFNFESIFDLESFYTMFYNQSLSDVLQNDIYFTDDIQNALEIAYFKTAHASFADFNVNITDITSYNVTQSMQRRRITSELNDTVSSRFDIYTTMYSINSTTVRELLAITQFSTDLGSNFIAYLLPLYDYVSSMNFSVISVYYEEEEEAEEAFSVSSGTFISIGVTAFLFIIAGCGFLHSKGMFCFKNSPDCDDTLYLSVMSYGMQIFDLYTDITFSLELWAKYQELATDQDNDLYALIEFLWVLSLVFIALPYAANLIMAITFQSESRFGANLTMNFYSETWFRSYNTIFCLFVMLSGSVFASLQLVNCKLFGMFIFHAGISSIEIESIDKLKIYYITLMENVPQLMIQIFYITNFGEDAVTVTFVASTVSSIFNITLTVMSFIMRRTSKSAVDVKRLAHFNIEIAQTDDEPERMDNDEDIIPREVKDLHRRQGRRGLLTKNVTITLNRLDGNFEFLYSVQHAKGIKIYGICVSDTPSSLRKQIAKFEKKLISVIKNTFSVEIGRDDPWSVVFEVMDYDKDAQDDNDDGDADEGGEGDRTNVVTGTITTTDTAAATGVVTTTDALQVEEDKQPVLSSSDTDITQVEMERTGTGHHKHASTGLMEVLSDHDLDDINALLTDIN